MPHHLNAFGQPVGAPLPDWTPRPLPPRRTLEGRTCLLRPLDPERDAADLHAAFSLAPDGRDWTYLMVERFDPADAAGYRAYAERLAASSDPLQFAVVDRASGRAVGTLALMRIDPANGVIEVGSVAFSPAMQRTVLSTEAQFLLMKFVFDELGYRRYEWKCDSHNAPSRRAAARLGFQFEGVFRQAVVTKGRNRDTAWFSIIDAEWPARRAAFERWLSPGNFDGQGRQRAPLAASLGA